MMRKRDSAAAIVILMTLSSVSTLMILSEKGSAYVPHDPIYIDGNGDFIPANGIAGGTGTPIDPFIIEGWEINAQGGPYCLEIHNTDAHFVLRDSYLHYPEPMMATCVIFDNVSNGTIHNSTISNHGMGIGIAYSNNIAIQDSNISGAWHDGIGIGSSTNISILNNTLSNRFKGMAFSSSRNVNVSGNKVSGGTSGISLWDTEYANITKNVLSYSVGIYLQHSNHSVISDNTVSTDVAGIRIEGSHSNIVTNNTVTSVASYGIDVIHSYGNTFIDNTVFDSQNGFLVDFSDDNSILNNTLTSNRDGIRLWFSDGNVMANNSVLSSENGVEIYDSMGNIIINNTVASSSARGMTLSGSDNCLVYHNNISDNAIQGIDNRDSNQWDNGYPLGGNYWSDYGGVDQYSGPNQDLSGSDGLGDTPYVIDADSQDRYPLMKPQGVIPQRQFNLLSAVLSGQDSENVTLVWFLSPDDGQGNMSIVNYEVYRNVSFDSDGIGYALIASLPNGTSSFVDSYAGEGNPNNYFYRICSLDVGGKRSFAETQGGKFTRSLSTGLDIISIPLVQSDNSISSVFRTLSYDKVWTFDSNDGDWDSFADSKPYSGDLVYIDHASGLWVSVVADSNLTIAGVVPLATAIHLKKGWNFVGFPSFDPTYAVGDLKAATGATRVEGFEPSAPPYNLRVMNGGELLQAGHGYWIYVETETTWFVQNL